MDGENPYVTPETDPIPTVPFSVGQLELATPGERFTGAFIDGLIGSAISIPLWRLLLWIGVTKSPISRQGFGFGDTFLLTTLSFVLIMAVQWKSLKTTGQTIGKKMAKTRIVTMDGRKPEITDLVFKRYAFMYLIRTIPVVGVFLPLINVLLVFRKDRRCLHDMVAGTQVVKLLPGQAIV